MATKAIDKLYVEQHDGTIFDVDGEITEFSITLIPPTKEHPCHVELLIKLDNINVKNGTVKNVEIVKDGVILSTDKVTKSLTKPTLPPPAPTGKWG